MSLRNEYDENHYFSDVNVDEDYEDMPKRREIRKKLEEKLERKRLKESFDELDGEFDWDDYEK